MDLSDFTAPSRHVSLSVSRTDQWLLHSILLDRIDREATAAEPTTIDPPPLGVFQAFERLDAGKTSFTIAQLEPMQTILIEYQQPEVGESESTPLDCLLHQISDTPNQHRGIRPAEG